MSQGWTAIREITKGLGMDLAILKRLSGQDLRHNKIT